MKRIGGGMNRNWFSVNCWPAGGSCYYPNHAILACNPAGSRQCDLGGGPSWSSCLPIDESDPFAGNCMAYDPNPSLENAIFILDSQEKMKNVTCDDGETCSIYCFGA